MFIHEVRPRQVLRIFRSPPSGAPVRAGWNGDSRDLPDRDRQRGNPRGFARSGRSERGAPIDRSVTIGIVAKPGDQHPAKLTIEQLLALGGCDWRFRRFYFRPSVAPNPASFRALTRVGRADDRAESSARRPRRPTSPRRRPARRCSNERPES